MLGTWFTDHKTQATSRSAEVPVGTSSKNPFSADALDLSADETIPNPTALVGTPHDDILAELYGQNAQAERSAARVDAEKSSQVNMSADKNVAAQDSPPPESTVPTVTSASASTSVPISRLYDPFSGAALGVLAAPESDANPFGEASPEDDELWLHMAGILKLQSDIAEMHLQMEDVGAKMGQGARDWEDAGEGGDEDEGMEGDEEVDKKKAREERFARLAGTFTGRREKIDEVMNKLGELSQALTTFNALRTPVFEWSHNDTRKASPSTHPSSPNNPPAHEDTTMSNTDPERAPLFPKTHSTPQLPRLSHTRPQPVHYNSQPGPSTSTPFYRVLQQPAVESPLSIDESLPDE